MSRDAIAPNPGGEAMPNKLILSHTVAAAVGAAATAVVTIALLGGQPNPFAPAAAQAQQPAPPSGQRVTDVMIQPLPDIGREMRIRVTERDPGNGTGAHRHPGHHTFGYVLEGTYELRIDNGPVRHLKAGDSFYEPPGSLHAVSRNPTTDTKVRYLVIQVADPSKPATVPEN
jgi:quercetin dioxygenase-like cupin family protein